MHAPEEIFFVSHGPLATACSLGGCTFNGAHYTYNVAGDVLVRDDVRARREARAQGDGRAPAPPPAHPEA
jgi:hypothetical protein